MQGSCQSYYFCSAALECFAPPLLPVYHGQDSSHPASRRLNRLDRSLRRTAGGDRVLHHDHLVAGAEVPLDLLPVPCPFASFRTLNASMTRSVP